MITLDGGGFKLVADTDREADLLDTMFDKLDKDCGFRRVAAGLEDGAGGELRFFPLEEGRLWLKWLLSSSFPRGVDWEDISNDH